MKTTITRRVELLLALYLFLPVIFEPLFKENTEASGNSTLAVGTTIGLLIACYCLLEFRKRDLPHIIEKITNVFIFINITAFVPSLLMLSHFGRNDLILFPYDDMLSVLMWILFLGPFFIFATLLVNFINGFSLSTESREIDRP